MDDAQLHVYISNSEGSSTGTASDECFDLYFTIQGDSVKNGWNNPILAPSVAPTGTGTIALSGTGTTDGTGKVESQSTNVTLTVSGYTAAGTGGALSYKWFKGATELTGTAATGYTGTTSPALVITKYDNSFAGTYKCEVYNTETGKGATIAADAAACTKTLSTTKIDQTALVAPTIKGTAGATFVDLNAATGGTAFAQNDTSIEYAAFKDGENAVSGNTPVVTWQTATKLTGLSADTDYDIYARKLGNNDYNDVYSAKLDVKTDSGVTDTVTWNDSLTLDTTDPSGDTLEATFGDAAFDSSATSVSGGTVTYESTAEDVAKIDATGKVTILKAGTTTISATSAAIGNDASGAPYVAHTKSYTLTVAKANPTITFGNNSQTEGNITEITATVTPISTDAGDAVAIKYEIPVPGSELVHCDCGFGNNLAHARDCAYVADQTQSCDCAYSNDSDATTLHDEGCAYKVADAGSKCNCGLGDADAGGGAADPSHASGACKYAAAVVAVTEQLAWGDTPSDTTYASVKAYLDSLKSGDEVKVVAAISGAGANLNAKTENGVLKITAKQSGGSTGGGGGGGTSSYTVKFDAGKNGKITKGNASASVSSGSKVASSKIPEVTASEGYKFLGWSIDGKTTVDPTEQKITKSVTFTALYEEQGVKSELAFDKTIPGGYMSGYPDGTFGPERSITREEVAAMFARILTEKMESGKAYPSDYTDVAAGRWSADAVGFLSGLGVIEGYGDGTFKPEQPITRAEFISMAIRVDGVVAGEDSFSDISGHWARENIQAGAKKGFITGYPDGTFKPQQSITRAEAVTIVNRVLGVSAGGDMPYTDVPATHWAHGDIAAAAR